MAACRAAHICVGYVYRSARPSTGIPGDGDGCSDDGARGQDGVSLRWPARHDREAVHAALARSRHERLQTARSASYPAAAAARLFWRALAQEAELLLMDELLTGLDMPSQEAILTIIDRLHTHGITVMVASHDLNQAGEQFLLLLLLNHRLVAWRPTRPRAHDRKLDGGHGGQARGAHDRGRPVVDGYVLWWRP